MATDLPAGRTKSIWALTITSSIPVGSNPYALTANPDGSAIYAANRSSDSVSVIDPRTNTVTATIPVGSDASWLATNAAGTMLYVVDHNGVDVIATATDAVVATVASGGGNTTGVAFNQSGSTYYITNYYDNDVSVVDAATNSITGTIATGSLPQGIAFTPGLSVSVNAAPAAPPVSTAVAALGSYTMYTVTIANLGPLSATGTDVKVTAGGNGPGNLLLARVFGGFSGTHPCTGGAPIDCTVGLIPPRTYAVVQLLIEPEAQGATVTVKAAASADQYDPDLANNSAAATVTTTNANKCTTIGTPGADSMFAGGQTVACELGGNDTLTAFAPSNSKIFIGSGADTVNVYAGTGTVIFGGYGHDMVKANSGIGATVYAGDYLYPGAAPDVIRAGLNSTCYLIPADLPNMSGCGRVIIGQPPQ